MVQTEQNIVQLVYAAKTDREAADALIQQYMGFIRSETVKFIHAAPEDGHEDELSLAMLAFYEAILHYERIRGSFLGYAAQAIRNRLIDHYRTEKRHRRVLSLHQESGEDREEELGDTLADQADAVGELEMREASRKEIEQFSGELGRFGLSLSDVAENCPRQGRTFAACRRVLDYARGQPELLRKLSENGRLPVAELAEKTRTDRKTIERHRKYLVAILLAFTNGFEIIRGPSLPDRAAEGRADRMKYLVMETHPAYAVLLDEEGRFVRAANFRYQVGQKVEDAVLLREPAGKRDWVKPVSGAVAAAACLTLTIAGYFGYYAPNFTAYGTLRMEINPSVQMTLSETGRVLDLDGLNADGETLAEGYDYQGKNRSQVAEELVERAIEMGFLSDGDTVLHLGEQPGQPLAG